jgi:hypothetical protein
MHVRTRRGIGYSLFQYFQSPATFTKRLRDAGYDLEKIPSTFCDGPISFNTEIMQKPFLLDGKGNYMDETNIPKLQSKENPFTRAPLVFDVNNIKADILKKNRVQAQLNTASLSEEERTNLSENLNLLEENIQGKKNEYVFEDILARSDIENRLQTEVLDENTIKELCSQCDVLTIQINYKLQKPELEVKKLQDIEAFVERIETIESLKRKIAQLKQMVKSANSQRCELIKVLDKHIALTTACIEADTQLTEKEKDDEKNRVLDDYLILRTVCSATAILNRSVQPFSSGYASLKLFTNSQPSSSSSSAGSAFLLPIPSLRRSSGEDN